MKQQERQKKSKEKILQAAITEFSASGYDKVTMENICTRHGISKGMMYHYYSGKDDLFLLCVQNMYQMMQQYLEENMAELEKKEKRQKEGMEAKRLRGEWDEVGRPRAIEQERFNQEFMRVVQKKVTPTQLQRELGLTSSTYYRYRKNFFENFPEFLQSV